MSLGFLLDFRITSGPFDQDTVKSDKCLQDEELKKLLASSISKKKKKHKKKVCTYSVCTLHCCQLSFCTVCVHVTVISCHSVQCMYTSLLSAVILYSICTLHCCKLSFCKVYTHAHNYYPAVILAATFHRGKQTRRKKMPIEVIRCIQLLMIILFHFNNYSQIRITFGNCSELIRKTTQSIDVTIVTCIRTRTSTHACNRSYNLWLYESYLSCMCVQWRLVHPNMLVLPGRCSIYTICLLRSNTLVSMTNTRMVKD